MYRLIERLKGKPADEIVTLILNEDDLTLGGMKKFERACEKITGKNEKCGKAELIIPLGVVNFKSYDGLVEKWRWEG